MSCSVKTQIHRFGKVVLLQHVTTRRNQAVAWFIGRQPDSNAVRRVQSGRSSGNSARISSGGAVFVFSRFRCTIEPREVTVVKGHGSHRLHATLPPSPVLRRFRASGSHTRVAAPTPEYKATLMDALGCKRDYVCARGVRG